MTMGHGIHSIGKRMMKETNLARLHAEDAYNSTYSLSQALPYSKPILVNPLTLRIHAFPSISEVRYSHLQHIISRNDFKIFKLVLILNTIILSFTCGRINLKYNK
jgi:predicted transcriptional regulator